MPEIDDLNRINRFGIGELPECTEDSPTWLTIPRGGYPDLLFKKARTFDTGDLTYCWFLYGTAPNNAHIAEEDILCRGEDGSHSWVWAKDKAPLSGVDFFLLFELTTRHGTTQCIIPVNAMRTWEEYAVRN